MTEPADILENAVRNVMDNYSLPDFIDEPSFARFAIMLPLVEVFATEFDLDRAAAIEHLRVALEKAEKDSGVTLQ